MIYYQATMRHDEKTFQALAHMQYDLFCRKNLVMRTVIGIAAMGAGIVNFSQWWGVLLIAYGSYLITGKYNSANHTAHKLSRQIRESGMDFPSSRYVFRDNAVEIIPLPENVNGVPLVYTDIFRLGEDLENFYLFRDRYGGYVVPKAELGEKQAEFRTFIEQKTNQRFRTQVSPLLRLLWKKAA